MGFKLFTDSSIDLPKDLIEKHHINVIPLKVSFQNETFLDRVNLSVDEFYQRMRESDTLPKTASPSPQDFIAQFEREIKPGDHAIVLCLHSELSSTYQSAKIAVNMYKEDHPDQKIEAIDTNNASSGLGLILLLTALMDKVEKTYEEILFEIKQIIQHTHTIIFLDTLENVVKGGRIDRVRGKLASVLSIKLIMKDSIEGLEILDKVRGSKKAMRRFIELIEEYGGNMEQKILNIAHSNCEEKALELKALIEKKFKSAKIILTEIGPTIGTYASEGGLVVAVNNKSQ